MSSSNSNYKNNGKDQQEVNLEIKRVYMVIFILMKLQIGKKKKKHSWQNPQS